MATKGKAGKLMHGVSRAYGLESHLFRIQNFGKETNRPKKCIYFLLHTEEYFAFYRTFNRVYSISIDLIIFNNYIDAQNIRITDEVIFCHVTDPGLSFCKYLQQTMAACESASAVCESAFTMARCIFNPNMWPQLKRPLCY